MKSCNGCKYLVNLISTSRCAHDDPYPYPVYEKNPYTGRKKRVYTGYIRPTIHEMRSEKGACGPEARLYEPTLLRRIFSWIRTK